jgi:hypothetical protein
MSRNLLRHHLDDLSHRQFRDGVSPPRFAGVPQEPFAAQGEETVAHVATIRGATNIRSAISLF